MFKLLFIIFHKYEISQLEKREIYLIEKLQNTQNLQKRAFDELEKVISVNPNDLNFENTDTNKNKKKGNHASKKI